MDQLKHRVRSMIAALPPGQRFVAAAAVVVLLVVAVAFFRWLNAPSYTLLYGGLDDKSLSAVIGELDAQGIPYEIANGGSQVNVSRAQVYQARALLAEAGVSGSEEGPKGYELLESQGFAVSDFRQRVDYQRALEGELSKTLMVMDGVESAQVRLAVPEDAVFEDEQQPVTASVLLSTTQTMSPEQVESVVFLISSSVEGLETKNVVVADSQGQVLSSPGDDAISSISDRNLRQTRAYEAALASDIQRLLSGAGGSPHVPSVVVRAQLNFDETSTETETFDPESQVTLREDTSMETLGGDGAAAQGVAGVDGGMVQGGSAVEYLKENSAKDYGVSREIVRTTSAPGRVEKLSVAIVMDDGSESGAQVPSESDVEQLVTAALGLDPERGDTIQVEGVAMAIPDEDAAAGTGMTDKLMEILPQVTGAIVLLLVAFVMFKTARGGKKSADLDLSAFGLPPVPAMEPAPSLPAHRSIERLESEVTPARLEVQELVQRQPDDIASLLRNWLADRRR